MSARRKRRAVTGELQGAEGLATAVKVAAACALAGVAPSGCAKRAPDPEPARIEIVAEFAGCAAVRRGPTCEVTPRTKELRVWVESIDGAKHELKMGGAAIATTASKEVGGGVLLTAAMPPFEGAPGMDAFEVVVTTAAGRGRKEIRVERVAEEPRLERVQELRQGGKLDEAQAAMPAPDSMGAEWRGRAVSLQARLALAKGKVDEAERGLRDGIQMHRREGRASDEVLDAMALSHVLLQNGHRISPAREALESVGAAVREWDEGRAQLGLYLGRVHEDSGNWRAALREFRATDASAGRLGLDSFQRRTQQLTAFVLQSSGDNAQALSMLRGVEATLPPASPPCERAELATNRSWMELLMMRDRSARSPLTIDRAAAPTGSFRAPPSAPVGTPEETVLKLDGFLDTVAIYERDCPRREDIANARLNVAHAALAVGDLDVAKTHVEAVRQMGDVPRFVALDLLEVDGGVALRAGDYGRALKAFDSMAKEAALVDSAGLLWRATVNLGDVLAAMRREEPAMNAYAEAEAILDRQSAQVPVNHGRAGFLSGRDRSARSLIDVLVASGDGPRAMAVVRRARARALSAVHRQDRIETLTGLGRKRWEDAMTRYAAARERLEDASSEAWAVPASKRSLVGAQRAADEAAARAALDEAFSVLDEHSPPTFDAVPPQQGDAVLAYHDGRDGRLWALLQTAVRTHIVPIPFDVKRRSDAELAEQILAPLEPLLAQVRRLRLVPGGPLVDVDVHALPWHGRPLLAHFAVEYLADLDATSPKSLGGRVAAVVYDTRRDLMHAAAEGRQVEAALNGWNLSRLEGDAATRGAVIELLGRSNLFHFAGHARFDKSTTWDSALQLANSSELRVGDILALPRVPEVVVLSGCETGRAPRIAVPDAGLAHAFVAAGAEVVVAAVRPVDDRLAEALATRIYRDAAGAGWRADEAVRAAVVELAATMPQADWQAYRVFTR